MRAIDADTLIDLYKDSVGYSVPVGVIIANIEDAPTIEPEPQWIPCMERLPEENGEYLVVREAKGIYKYVDIVKKTNTSGDIASDIIAWMPLPQPYKVESEEV